MGEVDKRDGEAATSLKAALRQARLEQAERSLACADLREIELGRLDLLREMLEPVMAEVPSDVAMFDLGIVPGAQPRLFVDMIAYVELARDRRTYRFVQERRTGRVILAESEKSSAMVEAVTAYVARRLVEREVLLASVPGGLAPALLPPQAPRRRLRVVRIARVIVDGLGVATLAALIWLGFHFAHGRVPGW